MEAKADTWHRARLKSIAAPRAGAYLDAKPNSTLDVRLTNYEIKTRISSRLGMIMYDEWEGHCRLKIPLRT